MLSVFLNPDQIIVYGYYKYPIVWNGYIDNSPITILLKNEMFYDTNSYDFIDYPSQAFDYLRGPIIEKIDDYMKKAN